MDWAAFWDGLAHYTKTAGFYFTAFVLVIVTVWKVLDLQIARARHSGTVKIEREKD